MNIITGANIHEYVDTLVTELESIGIRDHPDWRIFSDGILDVPNGYISLFRRSDPEVLVARYNTLSHRVPLELQMREGGGTIVALTVDCVLDAMPGIRDRFGNEMQDVHTLPSVEALYRTARNLVIVPRSDSRSR